MKTLADFRAEIDAVDRELVPLLKRRLEAVNGVAAAKRRTGKAVYDPQREQAILEQVMAAAGDDYGDEVKSVFATLFEVAKGRQRAQLAVSPAAADCRLAVAGMGLIGGSFYKAALRAGYAVTGLERGQAAGLETADLVFVALPPEAIAPWIREHAAGFKPGAVVVDAGGVKVPVVRALADLPPHGWTFVGGHPMAGKEVSGYANSSADLFLGKSMILTPPADFPAARLEWLRGVFASLGFARTVVTTPERHDELIAYTSQLGHVIAAAYAQEPLLKEAAGFSAGSFANMTRIALADPDTWTALYLADREALLKVLDGFVGRLAAFRQALAAHDAGAVREFIAAGAAAKRGFEEQQWNSANTSS